MPIDPEVRPYGSWSSPVTTEQVSTARWPLRSMRVDGSDVYWLEVRPGEAGRSALVRRTNAGVISDVVPAGFSVRTRVHEYGGGSFLAQEGTIWCVHFEDQRLYRLGPEGRPQPITPDGKLRFADFEFDRRRNRLLCVCEDHTQSDQECTNSLVTVPADGGDPAVLAKGHDFYSSPRLSPDGSRLAWLTWDHPSMPWDGTELWVADLGGDGSLSSPAKVAGARDESIFQPQWSPDGRLHFVSDRTGWWNLYRWEDQSAQPLCQLDAEFGQPQWAFDMSTYAFSTAGIVCTYFQSGTWRLAVLEPEAGRLRTIETDYMQFDSVRATGSLAYVLATSPKEPSTVLRIDVERARVEPIYSLGHESVDPSYLSIPEPVEFPTANGNRAHALYYPPVNARCRAPEGDLPPLLVNAHGGPTSASTPVYDHEIQYFTSRGFAYIDVNYRGSSGYGRDYRDALKGQWGVADVEDCVGAARYLVEQGLAHPDRLAIRGGSAGGYTALCALTQRDSFDAGASYYGVTDLAQMDKDTHKFEAHYSASLVGSTELYRERSPIYFVDRIKAPLIVLQGSEDKIVPPNQAELIVAELRRRSVPFAYLVFPGEGHGFRRAENIARSVGAELYFYSRIFGFELDQSVAPLPIENLG